MAIMSDIAYHAIYNPEDETFCMIGVINQYGESHQFYMGPWGPNSLEDVWRIGDYNLKHPEYLIKKLISMKILYPHTKNDPLLVIVPVLDESKEPDFTNAFSLANLVRGDV